MALDNGGSTLLVFDDCEFRGTLIAEALKSLIPFGTVEYCNFYSGQLPEGPADMALLVTGNHHLSDPDTAKIVCRLRKKFPDMPLVALSEGISRADVDAAAALGLRGVIPGDFSKSVAIAAFNFIIAGGHYFPYYFRKLENTGISQQYKVITAVNEIGSNYDNPVNFSVNYDKSEFDLTPRQKDVLSKLRMGYSNKEIARGLNIAEATVKIHVRQLLRKFEAQNRTQLVVRAETRPGAAFHPSI